MYILLDMGREETGWFHLDIELDAPCEILAGFGEHLEDLRVRSAVGGRQFAAQYQARAGRQQFTHTFKRLGLRYLQLHIYARRAVLYYAGVCAVRYPVSYKPEFRCADGLHNRIFSVSKRTLELCMHEHYEDCPWREQALYAMDARIQMLCGYYLFEGTTFAQASLRLLALGQRADGLLELCAPARVPVVIPVFSLCFITAVFENWLYGGSLDFVEEMLPVIEKILAHFLSRRDHSGLVPQDIRKEIWNFYEWSPGLDGTGRGVAYEAPLQFLLIIALKAAEELCKQMGNGEKATQYHGLRLKLAQCCAAFLNMDTGLYATGLTKGKQQHYAALTQALAVCADVCPVSILPDILKALAEDDRLTPMTLSSHWYKYEALMRCPDKYGRFVLDDIATKWGRMIGNGATSFWETEKGAEDFANAGSLCHGWSAVPIYVYYRYVLGATPEGRREPIFCGLYEVREET